MKSLRITAVLMVLWFLFGAIIAEARSFTYSGQRKEIKAGVLIFRRNDGSFVRPSDALVFYVMDQRSDLKPAGWEFVNPLAPSRVTAEIASRWGGAYKEGDPVTKDMACYWEVRSDASYVDIAQFDVLFVKCPSLSDLWVEPHDREKLRKMVDLGGTLWLEGGDPTADWSKIFFIQNFRFVPGRPSRPEVPSYTHPLLARPHELRWEDIANLGVAQDMFLSGDEVSGTTTNLPDDRYFMTVVRSQSGRPVVSAAQYGSGHIVAVGESVAPAISLAAWSLDPATKPLGGAYAGRSEYLMLADTEDLKFAYNIVSWGSEHTTFHKNARHSGFSYEDVGENLAIRWKCEYTPNAGNPAGSSPAFLDDMVFVVDGAGVLHAFDLEPSRDRDGDGNPDEGIPDLSQGAKYDEIWRDNIGPASSPTAAYVPIGGGACVPAVFVTTLDGKVIAYDARTGERKGTPITCGPFQPDDPSTGKINIPPPVYMDGVLYLGGPSEIATSCRLYAYDYLRNTAWQFPRQGVTSNIFGAALSSPTVGYFRNSTTGSVEQVLYLPTRGLPNQADGGINCIPLKVFKEPLRRTALNRYQISFTTAAIRDDPATYELYYMDQNGVLTRIDDSAVTVDPMTPSIFVVDESRAGIPPGADLIADYEIDLTNLRVGGYSRQRIPVHTPRPTGGTPQGVGVLSSPAAGPNDVLYYAAENGSLYATQESGRGAAITKWRWYLGDPGAVALLGGQAEPVGAPAVTNDMVYFVANVGGQGVLLAFEADPVFMIQTVGNKPIDRRRPVQIVQVDTMNPGVEPIPVSGAPSDDERMTTAAYRIDYERGRITFTNFKDPRNTQTELTASQDIILRYYVAEEAGGSGMQQEEVHAAFPSSPNYRADDNWNNLRWFVRLRDEKGQPVTVTSSPTLLGETLFIGGAVGAVGKLVIVNVGRVNEQFRGLCEDASVVAAGTGMMRAVDAMPGTQCGPVLATVAGQNGMVAVATDKGLTVFYSGLTLITENNRVLEVDAGGSVVWACDTTVSQVWTTSPAGPTVGMRRTSLNRPTVARRIGGGGILIADTGNNRVVLIDRSGKELITISEFTDPQKLLPAGSPLRLNEPTDVSMWYQFDPSGFPEYHFLIADSGNFRVIELATRYRSGGLRTELVWTTRTLEQGKQYRYTIARRDGPAVMCIISNYEPQLTNPAPSPEAQGREAGSGALVRVNCDPNSPNSGFIDFVCSTLQINGVDHKLVNPTFFSREYTAADRFTDIITDARGVYVANYRMSNSGPVLDSPIKYYPASAHPRPLLATYAQLLPSGNILVTNRATEHRAGARPIGGEVFELSWDDRANKWKVLTVLDRLTGRGMGTESWLQQPSSAERT